MDTLVIGCETIKGEITLAMKNAGAELPVIWLESGLHNVPEKLRSRLQEVLDQQKAERVLLAFGYCGNSMAGIRTGDFELILPRVDDCISLLIGSVKERLEIRNTYFFTKGWLDGERNLWVEYTHAIEKYGEEQGKMIFSMMLSGYKNLAVVDTGGYELEEVLPETQKIAKELELEHKVIPGTVGYLENLFTGPWTEDMFLRYSPNTEIKAPDLTFSK